MKNFAATALGLVALLLAGITVSAISSGVDGMMVIVVGATGCGAVVLGLIAAWLLSSSGPGYDSVLSSVRRRHRNGQNVRARPAIRAAEPTPAPPPPPQIRAAAQPVAPEADPRIAAPAPALQSLSTAPPSPTVPRPHDRDLQWCDYTPPTRAARTPGQRRTFLGVGLLIFFSGVHDIGTGRAKLGPRGPGTYRAKQPFAFWAIVALQFGIAGALLSVAAREAMVARRHRRSGD